MSRNLYLPLDGGRAFIEAPATQTSYHDADGAATCCLRGPVFRHRREDHGRFSTLPTLSRLPPSSFYLFASGLCALLNSIRYSPTLS